MKYIIEQIIQHGHLVKEFRLTPQSNNPIPLWKPGAHINLSFTSRSGEAFVNSYTLIGFSETSLHIAIQLDINGHGGSRVLHEEFRVDDELEVSSPINNFNLHAGKGRNILIAGGIGITPMISMVRALNEMNQNVELHYLVKRQDRLIFLDQLQYSTNTQLHTYITEEGSPELERIIPEYVQGDELHACGPISLMNAIRDKASDLGWPEQKLHFESFGNKSAKTDKPIQVYLRQSDIRIELNPGTSILNSMIAADAFVSYECMRGECGYCYAEVISGQPIHRDVCLTPTQRTTGMTTCVSWAATSTLELDL